MSGIGVSIEDELQDFVSGGQGPVAGAQLVLLAGDDTVMSDASNFS